MKKTTCIFLVLGLVLAITSCSTTYDHPGGGNSGPAGIKKSDHAGTNLTGSGQVEAPPGQTNPAVLKAPVNTSVVKVIPDKTEWANWLPLLFLAALVCMAFYRDTTGGINANGKAIEETLAQVMKRTELKVARFLTKHSRLSGLLLILIALMILSPLAVFWVCHTVGKDWSDTVKNVFETAAILGGLVAVFKWVNERQDRAADILSKLSEQFKTLKDGRQLIDDDKKYRTEASTLLAQGVDERWVYQPIDDMLDFYILIYGIRYTRQVPDELLATSFRFWLSHYYRNDRREFRAYVNEFYPTLADWLHEDSPDGRSETGFFRPGELFDLNLLE
ncbi:MAG TPA: hypothetical protein VG347_19425 [Verrucomicrobiae bacterium]|nr:hypothetical protein [Verrucomicrobiae bacterium]